MHALIAARQAGQSVLAGRQAGQGVLAGRPGRQVGRQARVCWQASVTWLLMPRPVLPSVLTSYL